MIIPRVILSAIEKQLFIGTDKKPVVVIYGPRQVGKTTLAQLILKKYPEQKAYFNCDFLDVQEVFSYANSHRLGGVVKDLKLIVLDEAQRIENIGLVLKILVDQHPHVQVIATGSSSFDLSNKIKEPLTGRKSEFHLFPMSFEELYSKSNLLEQTRAIDTLLRFGSYPAVVGLGEEEAQKRLKEITGSYLFKDIFTFQDLKKPELLTKLLRLLAFQIGSEVSFHELAQQLGVDQTVIQRYVHLLEEAFVIFRLGAFKRNLRGEICKSRKIFFWDLGIRNTLIQNFNPLELRNDLGPLWENFCILERLKYLQNHQLSANYYFWRTYTQKEIDYIEESGGQLSAYEMKWNIGKKTKKPKAFLSAYKNSAFTVINRKNVASFIMPETLHKK
ncbi:MAG: ATP-binding protein [bacterium]|nr:ATP-binding protein [bacterium]